MNDTKVVRYDPEIKYEGLGQVSKSTMMEYNNGTYVTHAYYQRRDDEANAVVADMQERHTKLHADYRALEEHFLEVCTARNEWYECAERLKAQNEKLHQDINLIRSRAGDLAASAIAARRELQSCQSVIHLHGGFDPAYIEGAQKAMSDLSASLEALK